MSVMAPPWLKPPRTILLASMPLSTSEDISSLSRLDDSRIPPSSSFVLKSNEWISNLCHHRFHEILFFERSCDTEDREIVSYQAGIRIPKLAVISLIGLSSEK